MSTLSLTPLARRQRRRREDSDNGDGDEDGDASRQSRLSQTPIDSKRIRLQSTEDNDEQEEVQNALVNMDEAHGEEGANEDDDDSTPVPTPQATSGSLGGNQERMGNQDSPSEAKHKAGAIVRIKLTDFVTYTSAEFFPGPQLNMVIGPNGTGKSTLVCAICLGLGWGPQHLGRAKDPGEFVKHGCREATIEIELAGPPKYRHNPVVCRKIKREGNKSTFTLNGKLSSRSQILKLAQSFSIQVDNLCQFLPQDKVSEFAALSPVELLHSTQRAAAGSEMIDWHDNLKKLRAEQKKLLSDIKGDKDLLANLENRQELQRADVERMKQREEIKRRIELLESARPVSKYRDYHQVFKAAKKRKDDLDRQLRELKAEIEPTMRAVNAKQDYCLRLDQFVKFKRHQVNDVEEKATKLGKALEQYEDKLKDLDGQIEAEKKSGTASRQEESKVRQAINRIKREMEQKPTDFDVIPFNEKIWELKKEIRDIEIKRRNIDESKRPVFEALREKQKSIKSAEEQLRSLDSQAGQQEAKLKKLSFDSFRAYQWVLDNADKFEREVFGPPMMTCSIRDPKYADAVESLFGRTDLLTFTTQSRNDFRVLQRAMVEMRLHDISIRTCSAQLGQFQPPTSHDELQRLGFDGWARDYLSGPEPVLAMLCSENRLHQTPIALRDISDQQYQRIQNGPISSWVAGKSGYRIIRRQEYGPGAVSTRLNPIRPAKVWTDQPADPLAKQELQMRIAECTADIKSIQEKVENDRTELASLKDIYNDKMRDKLALEQEKAAKQSALVNYNALPVKLSQQESKLKDVEERFSKIKTRVLDIRNKQNDYSMQKAGAAQQYADAVEEIRVLHEELVHFEVRNIEALSDFEGLKSRNSTVRDLLTTKNEEVKGAMQELKDVTETGRKLTAEAEAVARASRTQPDLSELLRTVSNYSLDQLEADIDSERARLELTHEGNAGIVKEFEDREHQIQKLRDQLSKFKNSLDDYEHAINEIRGKWEPKLDALVQKISDAFSDSFARIGCAGQVTVDKVEDLPGPNGEPGSSDFDQWSIQIQVKFREHENLSVLDSHRQSGGERAVSTIFYLMALQSLSASPFRVVDEINQGMDPRNERMVHERMVDIACAPPNAEDDKDKVGSSGGSQYFLITPKLLSGLVYKPGMKVLCIVSGEHMPADYNMADFGHAIKKMKELTVSSGRDKGKGRAHPMEDGDVLPRTVHT